jgi:hypothetical protein
VFVAVGAEHANRCLDEILGSRLHRNEDAADRVRGASYMPSTSTTVQSPSWHSSTNSAAASTPTTSSGPAHSASQWVQAVPPMTPVKIAATVARP